MTLVFRDSQKMLETKQEELFCSSCNPVSTFFVVIDTVRILLFILILHFIRLSHFHVKNFSTF